MIDGSAEVLSLGNLIDTLRGYRRTNITSRGLSEREDAGHHLGGKDGGRDHGTRPGAWIVRGSSTRDSSSAMGVVGPRTSRGKWTA